MKKSIENFLKSNFKGNGKYYEFYNDGTQTSFKKFSKNKEFFKIIELGNDAPRGGKSGSFAVVEFTSDFIQLAKSYQYKVDLVRIENENKERLIKEKIDLTSKLINKIDGESFDLTCKRLAEALDGEFLEKRIFYSAVKNIRK